MITIHEIHARLPTKLDTMGRSRKGNWSQTFSGIQFWPLDPRPEEILLADVAHHLSLQTRYGGACRFHYSVAQHCVLAARNVSIMTGNREAWTGQERALRAMALLHDHAEAYLVDVPRPVKVCLSEYDAIEANLAHAGSVRFGLPLEKMSPWVIEADERMLYTEKRDLLSESPAPWVDLIGAKEMPPPYNFKIEKWSPEQAEEEFLAMAEELGIES
jgi:uncharacterized protein